MARVSAEIVGDGVDSSADWSENGARTSKIGPISELWNMAGIEEGLDPGNVASVTLLKLAIENYCYEKGLTYEQFSEAIGIDTTRIARIRGARRRGEGKSERPSANLIKEVHGACERLGVFSLFDVSGISNRSLYGFSVIRKHLKPIEYRRRYNGEWFGIAASTFNRDLFIVFSIRLDLSSKGFNVTYEQRDADSRDIAKYKGSAYSILDQIWVFMEEENNREFVTMNFQTSPLERPRNLFGVYMGSGGSVAASHPAAGKVGLVRTAESPRLREAKLAGWLEMDQLEALVDGRSTREILDYVRLLVAGFSDPSNSVERR
jgi:transcriptional regulator with XRE-family HTH domain